MTIDVRIVNLCVSYHVKNNFKNIKKAVKYRSFYYKFSFKKVLTFLTKYLSYIMPLRKESPLLTKQSIITAGMCRRKKIKKWIKKPEGPPWWTNSTALRCCHRVIMLKSITIRPSLPAVRARLAEVGPIKSPLESNSAPSTATAKKTKAWRTSKSCLAQASVRNGKRAISKSPAPAHHASPPASNKRTIPAGPRQIQYKAAAPPGTQT